MKDESGMTNSEIRCEHINTKIFMAYTVLSEWCEDCGAMRYSPQSQWQLPTRTPEPTRAELEKMEEDVSIYGATYRKDGKRVDPKDIFINIPTKAENGLVKLNDELIETADKYANDLVVIKGQVEVWNKENQQRAHYQAVLMGATAELLRSLKTFGTPSITKEQLLAILPEKKRIHPEPAGNPDILGSNLAHSWFNEAIDQMKQRIDDLFKCTKK